MRAALLADACLAPRHHRFAMQETVSRRGNPRYGCTAKQSNTFPKGITAMRVYASSLIFAAAASVAFAPACTLAAPPTQPGQTPTPATAKPAATRETRLLDAITRHDEAGVRVLIQAGADVNTCELVGNRRPALAVAAASGSEAIASMLIEHGAKVNGYTDPRSIPLLAAIDVTSTATKGARIGMIRLLLEHGADPNVGWADMSAAESAITFGQLNVLELLIKHGLKLNARTGNGWTPLELAANSNSENDRRALRMLLDAGSDPNVLDRNGSSVLATVKSEEVRSALRAAGGKEIQVQLPDGVDLSTPRAAIASFVVAANRGDVRSMSICVSLGDPSNASNRMGWLHDAALRDGVQAHVGVTALKEHGDKATAIVETTPVSRDGRSLLRTFKMVEIVMLCRLANRWRIVAYPLEIGSDPSQVSFVNELAQDFDTMWTSADSTAPRHLSPNQIVDATECRLRMTALALALIQYSRKHNRVIAVTPETMLAKTCAKADQTAIGRYPSGGGLFRLNPHIASAKLSAIKEPRYTVLLFEGSSDKPSLRHGGHAMVAFCDGHSGLISPGLLKYQLWKPR